jgi:peptide/nickel transport system substrate-binding protein
MNSRTDFLRLALLAGVSAVATTAMASEPTQPPDPPPFAAQGKITFVNRADIWDYKALPSYSEPDFVAAAVKAGTLPAVKDRLPKEPLVFKTGNMPDGTGVYGDTLRHVIGGRPEGWNYVGGQSQGWGGIDIGLSECLTRTAQLFEVKAADLAPLPNLAKSWDWSKDGHTLTMHLIEGAKWSDGVEFTTDDAMFYWTLLHDKNVSPLNGGTLATFGDGTDLKADGKYTLIWTFKDAFPTHFLYNMAYGTFCPGPAHLLSPVYPPNSGKTYDDFKNAFPPTYLNFPTMGGWAVTGYRPDDVIILRRNPYYWKVDEKGQQLPYLNELHYKLSTWADRDVQAVAGSGDFSNLEQPESFVESLKKAAAADSPARLAFGPRIIAYSLFFNLSGNGWGEPDARGQALRELSRNTDFRKGVTMAIDRPKLGESLVKGPFTAVYPGGLLSGTSYYDKASTTFYPFDVAGAKASLKKAGVVYDEKGRAHFPSGQADGGEIVVNLLVNSDYQTDKTLGEGVQAAMDAIGIRVIINAVDGKTHDANEYAGKWDWQVLRDGSDLMSVVQNTEQLAPTGPQTSAFHRAGKDGTLDLLPFEKDLVDDIAKFSSTADAKEQTAIMKDFQKTYTSNVYGVGLTQYPGALIINKRFSNIPLGTPINMFNWAEDSIIRERVFVPTAKQGNYELQAGKLPGKPGDAGPM